MVNDRLRQARESVDAFLSFSPSLRTVRDSVRAFLLVATPAELDAELAISRQLGDPFRAACVRELLAESVG